MKNKGFTLIEMMVAIFILGIILTMAYQNFFYQRTAMREQRERSKLQMKARKASSYLAKEIRIIGYSQFVSGGDVFGIVNGDSSSLTYTHDEDGVTPGRVDNPTDIHSIMVRNDTLYIDGNFALREIENLTFIYTDTSGTQVTPPVKEVDNAGNWVLSAGNHPISNIRFSLRMSNRADTIKYTGLASLRNKRP